MHDEDGKREGGGSEMTLLFGLVWSLGVNFVVAVAGMAFLGWLLDRWLGTRPGFTIGGAIAGVLAGGVRFVRDALALNRRLTREERRRRDAR